MAEPGLCHDRRRCLLYGGRGPNGYLYDTWEWGGVRWHRLDVEGPPARGFAGAATDPAHGWIVLFGGREEMPAAFHDHDDTWELRGRSWIQR